MAIDDEDDLDESDDDELSDIEKRFDKFDDDYIQFDRIPAEQRRHPRPDICAFIYLHEKLGGNGDVVAGAEHDEIFLDFTGDDVEKLNDDDILYLTRCGVRYCSEGDGLVMFV